MYSDIITIEPNINRKISKTFFKLFDTIPDYWKENLKKNDWKIQLSNFVYSLSGDKVVFNICLRTCTIQLNTSIGVRQFKKYFYEAISKYVCLRYLPNKLKSFRSIIISESDAIMKLVKSTDSKKVFEYFFKLALENNGKENKIKKIKKTYEYVYKWYTGEIFTQHLIEVPTYIKVDEGVIDEEIQDVINIINLLPEELRISFLYQHNCKIRLITGSLWIKQNCVCDGLYNCSDNLVIINVLTENPKLVILHEFGHVFDVINNSPSIENEFLFIFYAERTMARELCEKDLEYEYISSNSMEFFAETFAWYFYLKAALKTIAPKTYEFLDGLLSK